MAFTRFHDDPCRKVKQNQQMTDQGRWILDVPGNGSDMPYMMDPQISVQKWGANLYTNFTDVSSQLLGIDRPLTRDCLGKNEYNFKPIDAYPKSYPTNSILTTEQSRAIMPAWTARDLEQVDWYYLPLNPQENVIMPFENLASTRILEKDYFVRKFDCPVNMNNSFQELPSSISTKNYVGGPNTCSSSNMCQQIRK